MQPLLRTSTPLNKLSTFIVLASLKVSRVKLIQAIQTAGNSA
jgi:hypothetical protein